MSPSPHEQTYYLIADHENLYGTTTGHAITENGGIISRIDGMFRSSQVTFLPTRVERLTYEEAYQRIIRMMNDRHINAYHKIEHKTIYRFTLADGQRLLYVQSLNFSESFLCQDSHESFSEITRKRMKEEPPQA